MAPWRQYGKGKGKGKGNGQGPSWEQINQLQKQLTQSTKEVKKMLDDATKLTSKHLGQDPRKEDGEKPRNVKGWECSTKTCKLWHDNPNCKKCRVCGAPSPKAGQSLPDEVKPKEEAPKSTTTPTPSSSNAKARTHHETMTFLKKMEEDASKDSLQQPPDADAAMEGEENKKETDANKIKELKDTIAHMESMADCTFKEYHLPQLKAELENLQPKVQLTPQAEMAKVLRLEASFINGTEALNKKMASQVQQAQEALEKATQELKAIVEKQGQLKKEQQETKQQIAKTKAALESRGAKATPNAVPTMEPAAMRELLNKGAKDYVPSEEIRSKGLDKALMDQIVGGLCAHLVQQQVVATAQESLQKPIPPEGGTD